MADTPEDVQAALLTAIRACAQSATVNAGSSAAITQASGQAALQLGQAYELLDKYS